MKTLHVIDASDVVSLKSLGSFAQVRGALESRLGCKLGCNGWSSIFNKLKILKCVVPGRKSDLLLACEAGSLRDSSGQISSILGVKVKVKTRVELFDVVNGFITMFSPATFDPYAHYEKTKLAKFKGSSKLEGIEIDYPGDDVTLESVLNKHRR